MSRTADHSLKKIEAPAVEQSLQADQLVASCFVDHSDGTITDQRMELMWQKANDAIKRQYDVELSYCQSL